MTIVSKFWMLISIVLLAGCSTITHGSRQDVDVKTKPPGLVARINTHQCVTPCVLQNVSRKESEDIYITYNGVEKAYHLDKSFNFWATIPGNIWNEIWIGLIVDVVSGATKSIEPVDMDFENSAKSSLEARTE